MAEKIQAIPLPFRNWYDDCSLRCFAMSVMFKRDLRNYSASFKEMGRKGLPNSVIFPVIPYHCHKGKSLLNDFSKEEFVILVYLEGLMEETWRMDFLEQADFMNVTCSAVSTSVSAGQTGSVQSAPLLQRRKFLPQPSSCCFSLLPLHTHPCQEIRTISPHTPSKNRKMQVDSPYCNVLCVPVSCVRIYLQFHFELLLLETGAVLCFFVSFQSNIFKDTDDTCLLIWKKKNILTFLEKSSFLVITVKLMHLAVEQERTSVQPVSE